MAKIIPIIRYANLVFGIAVILLGLGAFILYRSTVPLLLAIGLAVVGPFEDLLYKYFKLGSLTPEENKGLINQGTSLVFEIFLLAALLLSI